MIATAQSRLRGIPNRKTNTDEVPLRIPRPRTGRTVPEADQKNRHPPVDDHGGVRRPNP